MENDTFLVQNTEIEIHLIPLRVNLYKNKYETIYKVHQIKLTGDYSPSLMDLLTKETDDDIQYVLEDKLSDNDD